MEQLFDYIKCEFQKINNRIDVLFSHLEIQTADTKIIQNQNNKTYNLYEWLYEWLETYKKPNIKASSLNSILFCINKHIKQNIENQTLNQLTGLEIQKALNKIETSRMRKYTYDTYNAAFRQAQLLGYMQTNIMQQVNSVKHKRKQGSALTVVEQKDFIYAISKNKLRNLYLFYLLTGCRKSEALLIKWTDVDFLNNTIHICGTKTQNADRVIPLFKEVKTLLANMPHDNELIFPYSPNLVKCNFDRLKKYYGFKFRIHDLRHTFATRCCENGISLKVVQKWLGHSKLDTTANIYTHIQADFEKAEIMKYNPKIS